MVSRIVSAFIVAAVSLGAASSQPATRPAGPQWGIKTVTEGDSKLPTILLIGDSVTNAYSKLVGERLKGVANVDLFITPKHVGSGDIHKDLKVAVTHRAYKVIHFNDSGLHAWAKGRVPEGQYGPLLGKYVATIRENAPDAKLIWASTTPVTVKGKPTELDPAINPIIEGFNRDGRKVIGDLNIPMDDLYELMIPNLKLSGGDGFHWKPAGSALQADAVAAAIRKSLE